jgi:ATP-dependent RNA helicase RhlE
MAMSSKILQQNKKTIVAPYCYLPVQGEVKVVVATDLLARGMDLPVGYVVQYDFAQDSVSYLHRVGRTARAGASGGGG